MYKTDWYIKQTVVYRENNLQLLFGLVSSELKLSIKTVFMELQTDQLTEIATTWWGEFYWEICITSSIRADKRQIKQFNGIIKWT